MRPYMSSRAIFENELETHLIANDKLILRKLRDNRSILITEECNEISRGLIWTPKYQIIRKHPK